MTRVDERRAELQCTVIVVPTCTCTCTSIHVRVTTTPLMSFDLGKVMFAGVRRVWGRCTGVRVLAFI